MTLILEAKEQRTHLSEKQRRYPFVRGMIVSFVVHIFVFLNISYLFLTKSNSQRSELPVIIEVTMRELPKPVVIQPEFMNSESSTGKKIVETPAITAPPPQIVEEVKAIIKPPPEIAPVKELPVDKEKPPVKKEEPVIEKKVILEKPKPPVKKITAKKTTVSPVIEKVGIPQIRQTPPIKEATTIQKNMEGKSVASVQPVSSSIVASSETATLSGAAASSKTSIVSGKSASSGYRSFSGSEKMGTSSGEVSSSAYFNSMRLMIERNKRYPQMARRRNQEGSVRVRFLIDSNGNVNSLEIVKGSDYESLNQAALEAVKKAAPFSKPPTSVAKSALKLELTINFTLI